MASRCPAATGASFFGFSHSYFKFPISQFSADDTATPGDFRSFFTSISFYYSIIHILLVLEFGLTHVAPHGATCRRFVQKRRVHYSSLKMPCAHLHRHILPD